MITDAMIEGTAFLVRVFTDHKKVPKESVCDKANQIQVRLYQAIAH
jgi:hypothetical protein